MLWRLSLDEKPMNNLSRDLWSVTLSGIHWRLLIFVLIAQKECSLRERTYRCQEVSGSHIKLEKNQDMIDNEPIVSTSSQLEVNKPVE